MSRNKNVVLSFPSSREQNEDAYCNVIKNSFFPLNADRKLEDFTSLFFCYLCLSTSKSIHGQQSFSDWPVFFRCSKCNAEWYACKICKYQNQPKPPNLSKRAFQRISIQSHDKMLQAIKRNHHSEHHTKNSMEVNNPFQNNRSQFLLKGKNQGFNRKFSNNSLSSKKAIN